MIDIGRNDLCHCGSGKKYKKCHLDADQRSRAGIRQSQPDSVSPAADAAVEHRRHSLSEQGSAQNRKEFGELLLETKPMLEYLERLTEIEAAAAELEAHRLEFQRLAADDNRYQALAEATFAEECFAPLRFTATDVQRAFDHVGYPATMSPDEQMAEILRAAILHVADKERRSRLAMSLLLRLPEFVTAGRYLEAWLLQCSAHETAEDDEQSNAFLFQMFSYGYDAWTAAKRAKDESLLRKLGLNPASLRTMSLEELDSLCQSQAADAVQTGTLEAFFRENPHLREESIANLQALERNSSRLLQREDSRFLHLRNEEIQPWLSLLNERASQQGFLSGRPDGAASEEDVGKMFEELALPLMREMADSIFTRDRIRQLVADLRKYRSERFAAGDQETAGHATGAIHYVEREDSPGQNSFLLSLCWASLDSTIKEAVAEQGHIAD